MVIVTQPCTTAAVQWSAMLQATLTFRCRGKGKRSQKAAFACWAGALVLRAEAWQGGAQLILS